MVVVVGVGKLKVVKIISDYEEEKKKNCEKRTKYFNGYYVWQ